MKRIGIVGLGGIGILHGAIVNALPESKIVAAADADKRLVSVAKRLLPKIQFYSDLSQMLKDSNLDGVFVCTPIQTHFSLVVELVNSLSPAIFVEKPLAASAEQAARLAELARQRSVHTMVGLQKRFNPIFQRARTYMSNGDLGEFRFVRAHHFTEGLTSDVAHWRSQPEAGGVLLDWGVHLADLLVWMFGPVRESIPVRLRIRSRLVEDYARANVMFSSGLLGTFEVGWGMEGYNPPELSIEVVGTDGILRVTEDKLEFASNRERSFLGQGARRTEYAAPLYPPIPFLLGGQPEIVIQDQTFVQALNGSVKTATAFDSVIPVHEFLDTLRGADLT